MVQYKSKPKVDSLNMDIIGDILPQQLMKLNDKMQSHVENMNDLKDIIFDVCIFHQNLCFIELLCHLCFI